MDPIPKPELISPERQAVIDLTTSAEGVLDASGAAFEELDNGDQMRTHMTVIEQDPKMLTETVTPDGARSYTYTSDFFHTESDRGGLIRAWGEGSSSIEVVAHAEVAGDAEQDPLTSAEDIRALQADVEAVGAQPVPVGRRRPHAMVRPRGATAETPDGDGAVGEATSNDDTAKSPLTRAVDAERAARAPKPELTYDETLKALTDRLDVLVDDETVIWIPDPKSPDTKRSVHMSAPGSSKGVGTEATVQIIDEPGRPRWYVMDLRDHTLIRRPRGNTIETQHEVLFWSKGRERALANGKVNREGEGQTRVVATLEQLRLADKLTDPEVCQVPRKVAMSREQVAELPVSGRVANGIGRLLGKKNVRRFW